VLAVNGEWTDSPQTPLALKQREKRRSDEIGGGWEGRCGE